MNALKNGLLPVVVEAAMHQMLFQMASGTAIGQPLRLTIDLASQSLVLPDEEQVTFPIDSFNKTCLLEGLDSLDYLLRHAEQIADFEAARGDYSK